MRNNAEGFKKFVKVFQKIIDMYCCIESLTKCVKSIGGTVEMFRMNM